MMRKLLSIGVVVALAQAAMATVNYPFPQATAYSGNANVVTSTQMVNIGGVSKSKADALKARFLEWKSAMYAESGSYARIQFDTPTYTVSEGIGYGMLLMVYFSDATTSYETEFGKLWAYYKAHMDGNSVMNWKITGFDTPGCSGTDCNGATDGDIDAALALVMAYYQFGTAQYKTDAQALINAIYTSEVESNGLLRPGDAWPNPSSEYNLSYFSAGAVNVFKNFDANGARWSAVLTANFNLLKANRNASTGLVSDWQTASGAASRGSIFKSDAVRTPWRIALDAAWFGDTDAKTYSTLVGSWIRSKATTPSTIYAEYNLDGSTTQTSWSNSQYLGAFGSAVAVEKVNQSYLDAIWVRMMAKANDGGYYNASLRLLTGLFIGGMFPNLASGAPPTSSSSISSSSSALSSSSTPVSSSSITVSSSSVARSSSSIAVSSSATGVCIAFVAGTGGYLTNCYISGLDNMVANTCYTQSAGTADVQWISTSVSDAYWWTAVSCNGAVLASSSGTSSSVSRSSSGTTANVGQAQNSMSWSVQHGELQIIVVNAGMVNVKVLDLMGHIESVPVNSSLTAGSHTVMLGQLNHGMHIVRVQTGRGISSRTITIR